MDKVVLKTSLLSLYHFGLFRWRYKPVLIVLFQDRLVVKYLGFIKVRDVALGDIKEALIPDEKWINKFAPGDLTFFMIRMNYPLVIVYKKDGESKKDYVVGREEIKLELLQRIQERIKLP